MARRELQEINAGSMADIAFLLLIFFLVTTTMDQDKGILRQLPPIMEEEPEDKDIVKKKNVYEVLVNANDQLLVEDNLMAIGDLKDGAISFLTNSGVFSAETPDPNLTEREWVNKADVISQLSTAKGALQSDPENAAQHEQTISKLESKLDAINFFGRYRALNGQAVISLKNDNGTSYDTYLQVQNELTSAINELRDGLTLNYYEKTYLELDDKDEMERRIIRAVREVYPQRISEAEPAAIGTAN
jgi:biopolymer transport protein ExbD